MSAKPLKYQIILSTAEARKLILRLQEPRQSILLERLERMPVGFECDAPVDGLKWRVTGYKWYPKGMGESGRDATLWPMMMLERKL